MQLEEMFHQLNNQPIIMKLVDMNFQATLCMLYESEAMHTNIEPRSAEALATISQIFFYSASILRL